MKKSERLLKLEKIVEEAYLRKNPNRDEWADWIYPNDVLVVADNAEEIAEGYGASVEESRAIALLHDVADVVMARKNPEHETKSLELAEEYLFKSGFSEERIRVLVGDALRFHSCRDGNKPKSLEGKVLSTADAIAHINTDFYEFVRKNTTHRLNNWFNNWITEKLPRDYNEKISFEEVQNEVRARYEELLKRYNVSS